MAGIGWIIFGLMCAGVGIIPVAAVAAMFHGEWSIFFQIIGGIVVIGVVRFLGNFLIVKSEPKEEYFEPPPMPPTFDE